MSLRLAIDFDATIVEEIPPLRFRPGAREALERLKTAGHHLILFSARATPETGPPLDDEVSRFYQFGEISPRVEDQWMRFHVMRVFLQLEGAWTLFDEVWQAPGKPHADLFIDDRFERPNWPTLLAELGVSLA